MTRGFLPNTDAGLLAWSLNFSAQIAAAPATFGFSAVQAAAYAGLHAGYAPALAVVGGSGWTVKIKLRDSASSASRGLPVGVSGASVFSFVGAQPPSALSAWKFECNTGRSSVEVQFASGNPPGTQVWLTAFWFNGRKQSGPVCAPVSTNLQGGSVSMAT